MEIFNRIGKRGSQGIGTLIIFIALILVAAVAAGVIIQTGNSLQSKAFSVGAQTQNKLVTFMTTDSIVVTNTSDGNIDSGDVFIVKVRSGTDISDINLQDLSIQVVTEDQLQSLEYSNTTHNFTSFNVTYLTNGGVGTLPGYLTGQDVAEIRFNSSAGLGEKEKVSIQYSPRDGQTLANDFYIPGAMTSIITQLYP